jgi:hypothetical protein
MKSIRTLAAALVGGLGFAAAAAAQPPVAVIEEITGKIPGIEFMDYVTPGTVIQLGPQDVLVLGYMTSCLQERIIGGLVTVGREQSTVEQGKLYRQKVDCDSSQAQLAEPVQGQSAATVFRNIGPDQQGTRPAYITIYGRSPLVEVDRPGTLVIERLDRKGERHQVAIDGKSLVRGKFYDLAEARKELAPGVVYEASLGTRRVVFKIDPNGRSGATPVIGRLLRLE